MVIVIFNLEDPLDENHIRHVDGADLKGVWVEFLLLQLSVQVDLALLKVPLDPVICPPLVVIEYCYYITYEWKPITLAGPLKKTYHILVLLTKETRGGMWADGEGRCHLEGRKADDLFGACHLP